MPDSSSETKNGARIWEWEEYVRVIEAAVSFHLPLASDIFLPYVKQAKDMSCCFGLEHSILNSFLDFDIWTSSMDVVASPAAFHQFLQIL